MIGHLGEATGQWRSWAALHCLIGEERADMNDEQFTKAKNGAGFIAALDQSGGSTPKALKLYGIEENAYSNDAEMFDLVHEMRTRIITSPAFDGDRIMGAILFEMTMDREIEGRPTRRLPVERQAGRAVPQGRQGTGGRGQQGAQVMKPMPGLDDAARPGPRQRDVRHEDALGHQAARRRPRRGRRAAVRDRPPDPRAGLVPIIEPEVDIHSPRRRTPKTSSTPRCSTVSTARRRPGRHARS